MKLVADHEFRSAGFTWRGEPITDIEQWCRERGEHLVQFRCERKVPNVVTDRLDTETKEGEMPESFWNNLLMTHGWHYTETGRYKP